MDKKYIERPKNADCEKQERKQKQKDRRSVGINIQKKYEGFIKKSIKESDLSTPQFIIKITNDYVKKHNLNIKYIPMPDKRGRKEGYNK